MFQTLPKTSYYKMIDTWLMFTLLIQVAIFGLHTVVGCIINRSKKKEKEKEKTNQAHPIGKRAWPQSEAVKTMNLASSVNGMGKILIVVLILVFNCTFWYTALAEYNT